MFSFSGGYPSQGGVIFNANTGSDLDANQQTHRKDVLKSIIAYQSVAYLFQSILIKLESS
jgi:hypothetical protein